MVVPVYLPENLGSVKRLSAMAEQAGVTPIIVCNSASALARAQALGLDGIVVSRGENLGYGGAATFAADGRRFGWLILCNDDLEVDPVDFQRFIELVRSQASTDPWAIGLISWLEPDRPSLPGPRSVFANLSLLAAFRNRLVGMKHRPASAPQLAVVPRGTAFPFLCVALSAASWRALGGFDARYPLYFEDMDYLRRAGQVAGHRFGLVRASARHRGSTSARATLDHSLPILAWSASEYLLRYTRWRALRVRAMLGIALLVRIVVIPFAASPVRAHARGVVRAVLVLATHRRPPMPPWRTPMS